MAKPSIKVDPNKTFGKEIRRKDGVIRTNPLKIGKKLSKLKLDKKRIKTTIFALSLSLVTLVSCGKKENKAVVENVPKEKEKIVESTQEIKNELKTISIESLGKRGLARKPGNVKLDIEKVTGNVDKEKVVRGEDGNLYATEEDAEKSKNIGEQTTQTVTEPEDGYEIIDDKGNVTSSGDGSTPTGYDEETLLPEGYVYCDANYYDEEGNLILAKGDVVTTETLEDAKKYLSTNPNPKQESSEPSPSSTEEPTPSEDEPVYDEGTINPDGTYTKDGLTFESYEDYQQWVLQGYTGYGLDEDGIMRPIVDEDTIGQNSYQLVKEG